ncbi:hypothetical protein [Nocardioides caldifontis]|uniref:hypothetical protein n=1 Tax=Nocardioides caldifontis TaxID=2588938 RepID=UPI0011DFB200|nr:hypothetical protein [Nocardioides caldifontis]
MSRPMLETHVVAQQLAVICTDRGQHKRTRLTTVTWWRPLKGNEPDQRDMSAVGRHWDAPSANPHGSTLPYEFWCGVCRRNTQVTADRWWRLAEGARTRDMRDLDVSYLD